MFFGREVDVEVVAVLAPVSPSLEPASLLGGRTEEVKVDTRELIDVNVGVHLRPSEKHRSWQFVDPRRLVPVGLSGESCLLNRCRPLLDIIVDEAGYPRLVDRNLNC